MASDDNQNINPKTSQGTQDNSLILQADTRSRTLGLRNLIRIKCKLRVGKEIPKGKPRR